MTEARETAAAAGAGVQAPVGDAEKVVRGFLAAMECRDLDAAARLLAPGAVLQFPGAAPMRSLEELIGWAQPRYRHVSKCFDGFDIMPAPTGAVVYCRGELSGEWPDGRSFAGIRFIDRFEIRDGLIHRQDVWNDLGEARGVL